MASQYVEETLDEIIKKAEAGDADAQWNLGSRYCTGKGVSIDFKKAYEWLEKSALQDNAMAQMSLGLLYRKGEGVPKDLYKALEWLEKSSLRGNSVAQSILATMYYIGEGTPKDYKKAYAYYNLAAVGALVEELGDMSTKARDEIAKWLSNAMVIEAKELSNKLNEQIKKNQKK
jgi:hypothetical protein